MCTIIALRKKNTHIHTERGRYYNKWNVQNGLRLRLRNHRKFLKWISENQERSMGDNISWSNLPWPVRLMRRPCICLQSTGINDTCKTIKRFWWTLNNNNHSGHSWIGNSKNISKTKTIWPGMRLYSVQNEIVTIQDWRSIIFHFYASFFFSLQHLPFCYTDFVLVLWRGRWQKMIQRLIFAVIHHPRLQVQKRNFSWGKKLMPLL